MNHLPGNDYFVEPATIASIVDGFTSLALDEQSFGQRARAVEPLIATVRTVRGFDTTPLEGPLIVVKNHPCHYDGLLLADVFEQRPDLKLLAKSSTHTRRLPVENMMLLNKKGPHGDPSDIITLQQYLGEGGSLLATPWGSLDHQARSSTSVERATQNVVRFASFAGATVLPVHIETDWNEDNQLPLRSVTVSYQKAIPPIGGEPDADSIIDAVTELYERFAV